MPLDTLEDIYIRLRKLERRIDEAGRGGVPTLYHAIRTTTDGSAATIYTFSTATGYTYQILIRMTARRTGGSAGAAGDSASYLIAHSWKNISGVVTGLGSPAFLLTHEDQAGWNVTFSVSGTNVLCQVTGATNNTVNWDMQATIVQVT